VEDEDEDEDEDGSMQHGAPVCSKKKERISASMGRSLNDNGRLEGKERELDCGVCRLQIARAHSRHGA
jgi:hypothetical protein